MAEVLTFDKMQVGKKGGGKHWTKQQVESRKAAAQKTKRQVKVKLAPPQWAKDDADVFRIWKAILKQLEGIELMDNLDAYALATFCKLEAEKEKAILAEDLKQFESLARISLAYAKDLGLTARSRATLAKRIAEEKEDPNADLFE